jgi:hypothetical protein
VYDYASFCLAFGWGDHSHSQAEILNSGPEIEFDLTDRDS